MKKKLTAALCVVLILLMVAAVGGTFAYFFDEDGDANTMTVGTIEIVQNEEQRPIGTDGEHVAGALEAFQQMKRLLPAVYDLDQNADGDKDDENETLTTDGTIAYSKGNGKTFTGAVWYESIENEVDKIISVSNTGTEDAYIRTLIAMEDNADGDWTELINCLWCNTDGQMAVWPGYDSDGDGEIDKRLTIEVDGVTYTVAVCVYTSALPSGETSDPSLMQIMLDKSATNAFHDWAGEEYSVLALSQAVQAEGFQKYGSAVALNEAFGDVVNLSDANYDEVCEMVEGWFVNMVQKTTGGNNVIGGSLDADSTVVG